MSFFLNLFHQGVNLSASVQNGKLVFIEGLKYAINGLAVKDEETADKLEKNPFVELG